MIDREDHQRIVVGHKSDSSKPRKWKGAKGHPAPAGSSATLHSKQVAIFLL